jgi:hypothetical protein
MEDPINSTGQVVERKLCEDVPVDEDNHISCKSFNDAYVIISGGIICSNFTHFASSDNDGVEE